MVEVTLEGMGSDVEEGTIQNWLFEEGDPVNQGDNLVEVSTGETTLTVTSPVSGILAEVYYDEGEQVTKGEVLCTIDEEEDFSAEEDDEEDEGEGETDEEDEEKGGKEDEA
ncbi:MAG TPA: biotin/lipoyl-containing protein [bacterium]|nr:biotin/lipoyl-containing protein [bacterium]